jgi:hypothetical protein
LLCGLGADGLKRAARAVSTDTGVVTRGNVTLTESAAAYPASGSDDCAIGIPICIDTAATPRPAGLAAHNTL